jgi:hypothetical protein
VGTGRKGGRGKTGGEHPYPAVVLLRWLAVVRCAAEARQWRAVAELGALRVLQRKATAAVGEKEKNEGRLGWVASEEKESKKRK